MGDLLQQSLWLAFWISLPLLGAALVTALAISLFQAATQILEPTLSFVPKLILVALLIALLGAWMGDRLLDFAQEVWGHWAAWLA